MTIKRIIISIISVLLINGCSAVVYTMDNLPEKYKNKIDTDFNVTEYNSSRTEISQIYKHEIKNNKDKSGAILITDGNYALSHRVALIRMAKYSIEIQTYIYECDDSSRLIIKELYDAAERGVKIRIIIDDQGLKKDSSDIMLLNFHKNIQVRVFNPYKYRSRALRNLQFISDMNRMNYRMHNKLLIVDKSAVIIGGRNISDVYFSNSLKYNFHDTDIMLIGQAAQTAYNSFIEYWNYKKSIPVEIFPDQKIKKYENIKLSIKKSIEDYKQVYYEFDKDVEQFIDNFKNKKLKIFWGKVEIIADKPEKTEGHLGISPIKENIDLLMKNSKSSVYIEAAYFVPGKDGTKLLQEITNNGVEIYILTNSLSSNNVKIVYSGWDKYRDKLLKTGIIVYEFKNDSSNKRKNKYIASASLHSKAIVIDDNITWIGSFNLDERSALYNTEIVALIYSHELAKEVKEKMKEYMNDKKSWQVFLIGNKPYWRTIRHGKEIITNICPDTTLGQRMLMEILKVVPERLL